ncbi:hypothetical protein BDV93DRAFT_606204 [Ceratobasidium sp. AG-I]|nr:hypothetical protein BDV93DRAFT_606204 [Ceratobasidium sp. AG-I]
MEKKNRTKARMEENEHLDGPPSSTIAEEVASPIQDPSTDNISPENGALAHVAPVAASLPPLDDPLEAGSATTPAQPEDDSHGQDHPLQPSLDTQPDTAQEQEDLVAPPLDTRPPVKIRKVTLRVREPEPEAESSEVGRSRTSRVARSHRQPYQAAQQKRKTEEKTLSGAGTGAENVTGTEGAVHKGGPSTSTGPQGASAATQDPTEWLGGFWAELKEMLAATPSAGSKNGGAGPSTGTRTEDIAATEEVTGTEVLPTTGAAAENPVDAGSPPRPSSPALIPQAVVHDALRDLRSMLDDVKQSLAAAGSSAHPDISVSANSSNGSGSTEASQLFSATANSSEDTQDSELPDYEDAIGAGSSEVDVQVKQEEEEYVFPPWDGGVASGSQLSEDAEQEDTSTAEEEQPPVAVAPLPTDGAWTSRAKRQREDDDDDEDVLPLKRMRALVVTSGEDE